MFLEGFDGSCAPPECGYVKVCWGIRDVAQGAVLDWFYDVELGLVDGAPGGGGVGDYGADECFVEG